MFNGIDVGYIISTFPVNSWILDGVEVLGGASSFLYGSGAVGGAVNYVGKLASNQPLTQESLIRAGSFGQYQAAYGVNGRVGGPSRNTTCAPTSVTRARTATSSARTGAPSSLPDPGCGKSIRAYPIPWPGNTGPKTCSPTGERRCSIRR